MTVSGAYPISPIVRTRGGVILTMSILSLFIFGPITGVPAWIMANEDLRDISRGIASGRTDFISLGKVLAIIGTFCSPISLVLLFVFISVALQMLMEAPLMF